MINYCVLVKIYENLYCVIVMENLFLYCVYLNFD